MRQATKSNVRSTLFAALALFSASILIETASAVEVSRELGQEFGVPETPDNRLATTPVRAAIPSEDCFIMASRSFTIPFTVDKTGARPVEVRLYVSHGPADPWQLLAHKSPDDSVPRFEFTADGDGEYWFATRTIDAAGNPHPNDDIQPQMKVYVDTTKPVVELETDASADGRIDAKLIVDDATPIKEIVLRYVTDKAKEWQRVDASRLLAEGRLQFLPSQSWERMSMQLIATDKAGNQTIVNRLVQRPRVAELPANRYGASDSEPPTQVAPYRMTTSGQISSQTVAKFGGNKNEQVQYQADRTRAAKHDNSAAKHDNSAAIQNNGYVTGVPATPFGGYRGGSRSPQPSTPFFVPAANQTAPPTPLPSPGPIDGPQYDLPEPVGGGIGLDGPQRSASPDPGIESVPLPRDITGRPKQQVQKPKPNKPRTAEEAMRPLSEESAVPKVEKVPTPKPKKHFAKRPAPPEPPRAPVRHSDNERFSLEYELQAVGNLGVEAIELYGSTDGGKTWGLWGTDPDRTSPFDIETKEEGVFSFRIVVVGRNGLASPRPQSGETPDIVVVVDKEKPKTRITAAQYGEGNRIGALVIRYECIDSNLGARPITLSFSDSTSGPWTTIAAGLRNDGDYVWPADPKLPRQIYLRLDCKDEAGNVGTYILEKPIDVQGLAPRARIRGFQSLSGMEAFPVDEQTAERPNASFK